MRNKSIFNFAERRRFLNGCEILSKIHHNENVINYIEHGKIEGIPVFADGLCGKLEFEIIIVAR